MKFTIVCDESSTDSRHLIIGALVIPRKNHTLLIEELRELKKQLNLRWEGEVKWKKISRRYLDKYKKILGWFFNHLQSNHFRFRAHVIDTYKKEYRQYGEGDKETSFYKVFFHLLMQCVKRQAIDEEGSSVLILLDDKSNRYPFRLPTLKQTLNRALHRDLKMKNLVANVEPRESNGKNAEGLIQIVDILIGAIGHVRNGFSKDAKASAAKREMIAHIEELLKSRLDYDTAAASAFNIWTFDVGISMARKKQYEKKNRPKA